MGLDFTEIAMNIEDRFKIRLDDDELERVKTMQDLYECVANAIGSGQARSCQTLETFCVLRSALGTVCPTPRQSIRLDTVLSDVIPLRRRRRNWAMIRKVVPGLPSLRLFSQGRVDLTAHLALLVVCVLSILIVRIPPEFAMRPFYHLTEMLTILLVASAPTAILVLVLTRPFALAIPRECRSVRSILELIYPRNAGRLTLNQPGYINDDTWRSIVAIVAEVRGIPAVDIKPSSRLFEDLRVD